MQKDGDMPLESDKSSVRGRGRPRAFDREAALSCATRLFWTKGYEATSIADLTDAMGIGAPSLYAAFRSKDALFIEAVDHYQRTYGGLVWSGFEAADTVRDAVQSLLLDSATALTGGVADNPYGCMVTLSAAGSEGHPKLGEIVRAARNIGFERLEARLQRAVAEGEFPRRRISPRSPALFRRCRPACRSLLAMASARRNYVRWRMWRWRAGMPA